MRRIIPMALLALTLTGGVAFADRDHYRGRDNSHWRQDNRREWRRDNRAHNYRNDRRWTRSDRRVVVQRARPTFRNNRFYFNGGFYRTYQRPVIQYRYRNYYQRPAILVENYDPVPGYIWIQGTWNWDGYEWRWIPGHYEVDPNAQGQYYYDGYSSY